MIGEGARKGSTYRGEKKFVCFSKQESGRARQKFLATTYKPFFPSLYNSSVEVRGILVGRMTIKTPENSKNNRTV